MQVSPTTLVLAMALVGAATFAMVHENAPAPSGAGGGGVAVQAQQVEPGGTHEEQALPPNHPQVAAGGAAPTGGSEAIEPSDLRAAIAWKAPAAWPSAANPSPLRIATHKVPRAGKDAEDAELSVSRAGGDVESNIQRWLGQFEGASGEQRREKTVHGFKVSVVEVDGTYQGGMGAATGAHAGWALLGAIVEAPEQPYFFKLTGPAATVHAARPAFEALLDTIAAPTPP